MGYLGLMATGARDRGDSILVLSLARRATESGEGRRLRLDRGIGLREAARAVPCDASTLRRWEVGECRPTGERALAYGNLIAELLNADVAFDQLQATNDAGAVAAPAALPGMASAQRSQD